MSAVTLLAFGLAALSGVEAQNGNGYCRDRFGRVYRCNNGGLGYGARIGIGVGIAAGKFDLLPAYCEAILTIRCPALVPAMWFLEEKVCSPLSSNQETY